MIKGNAARTLFKEDNEEKTLELITADDGDHDIIYPTELVNNTGEGLDP